MNLDFVTLPSLTRTYQPTVLFSGQSMRLMPLYPLFVIESSYFSWVNYSTEEKLSSRSADVKEGSAYGNESTATEADHSDARPSRATRPDLTTQVASQRPCSRIQKRRASRQPRAQPRPSPDR